MTTNSLPNLDALQAMIAELSARPSLDASEFYEIVRRTIIPLLSSLGRDTGMLASRRDVVGVKAALVNPISDLDQTGIAAISMVMPTDTKTIEVLLQPLALVQLMRLLSSREIIESKPTIQGETT